MKSINACLLAGVRSVIGIVRSVFVVRVGVGSGLWGSGLACEAIEGEWVDFGTDLLDRWAGFSKVKRSFRACCEFAGFGRCGVGSLSSSDDDFAEVFDAADLAFFGFIEIVVSG